LNKLGSARDVILLIIVVFIIALASFVMNFFGNTAIDKMLDIPEINSSSETVTALQSAESVNNRFDYVVFGVFMAFLLAVMITGWLIGGNPLFMFVYFIIIVVGVLLAVVFANTWETIANASVFGTTVMNFPVTNHLLLNFPIYAAVIGVLGLVVMFAKPFISSRQLR